LLVADGKAADRAAAKAQLASLAAAEIAGSLRNATPEQLFAAYERDVDEGLLDMPRVFADVVVLPTGDPLAQLARPDGWNRVPVIAGTNRDENKLFQFMNPVYVKRWFGVVPQVRNPDLYLATADAQSAMWKATGADARRRDVEHAAEHSCTASTGTKSQVCWASTWAAISVLRTASRFPSCSATGISAGRGA
jgi:carboxylesterase type B